MTLRNLAKSVARAVATILVAPELLSYWLRAAFLGRDRALEGSTQLLSLVPGLIGQYLRNAFLRQVLAECHPSVTIEFGTILSQTGARLEENVYIGPRCHLGLVHLERDVLLAAGVHIPSGAHTHGTDNKLPIRDQPLERCVVRIGSGSWIGSSAVIMAAVGKNTIIGAGSVVTQAIPDQVIAVGAPARVIKHRTLAEPEA